MGGDILEGAICTFKYKEVSGDKIWVHGTQRGTKSNCMEVRVGDLNTWKSGGPPAPNNA